MKNLQDEYLKNPIIDKMIGTSPYGVNPYTTSTVAAVPRRSLTTSTLVAPGTVNYGAPVYNTGYAAAPVYPAAGAIAQANYAQPIRRSVGPVTTVAPVAPVTTYVGGPTVAPVVAPRISAPVVARSPGYANPMIDAYNSTIAPVGNVVRNSTMATSTVLPVVSGVGPVGPAPLMGTPNSMVQGSSLVVDHTPLEKSFYNRSVYNTDPTVNTRRVPPRAYAIPEIVSNGRSYTTSYPAGVDATFLQKQALGFNHSAPNRPRWTRPVAEITPPVAVPQTSLVQKTALQPVVTPPVVQQTYQPVVQQTYVQQPVVQQTYVQQPVVQQTYVQQPVLQQSFAQSVVSPYGQSMVYPGTPVQRVSQTYAY